MAILFQWPKLKSTKRLSLVLLFFSLSCVAVSQLQAYEGPRSLMVDLLEKTDVVWRDGFPTQLTLEETKNAIERLQTVEIRSNKPSFSWVTPAVEKNLTQKAWQIQLATSRQAFDAANEQTPLLWDSGKVEDASSTARIYGGSKPLSGDVIYYWRVRIWNQRDEKSDWSEIKSFKTAKETSDYALARYPLVKQTERPIASSQLTPNINFIDFGKASFGQIRLQIDSPQDERVALVRLGERIRDGRVDSSPAGSTRFWEYRLKLLSGCHMYTIKTRVDKRNTSGAAFLMPDYVGEVMPFRYAEVEFLPAGDQNSAFQNSPSLAQKKEPSLVAAERETVTYPFNRNANYFFSDNENLNKVWDLCSYSIEATSFAGVYLDGDRERIPYEGDALLNQLSHYSVDREYTLARFSWEYMIFHPTWPTEWNLQIVQMAWYDYLYTGDSRSIAKYYDDLKAKSLVALAEDNGLISTRKGKLTKEVLDSIHFRGNGFRDIVDWPHSGLAGNENAASGETDGFVFNDFNAVVNAYHFFALNSMKAFAQILGKQEDYAFFDKQIQKVRQSFQEVFFDNERGVYKDGDKTDHASLHSNMFALAFGLTPDEHVESVSKFIESRGLACSVYGAQFLLDAVYQGERDLYGLNLMTNEEVRGWINMLRAGSTITMEAWDDRYKPNQDWNHAWGAAPANIIPRKLVGVEPTSPGCATLSIKPQLGALKRIEAVVPTIRGLVEVQVDQSDASQYALKLNIPGNVIADVYVPYVSENDTLLIDGVATNNAVHEGKSWKLTGVGSGTWTIKRLSANK